MVSIMLKKNHENFVLYLEKLSETLGGTPRESEHPVKVTAVR